MAWCQDDATTFLKGIGYNVVRHPREGINPLDLIGRQNDSVDYLGPLNRLITNPPGALPTIHPDTEGVKIQGKTSSRLDFSLGLDILGAVIGSFGGNLGLSGSFTNARQIQFVFDEVKSEHVVPLEVGDYLRDGVVDVGNLILRQYVMGRGELFLITRVVKSRKFLVRFERDNEVSASVNVPALQQIAGAELKVAASVEKNHEITFEGTRHLTFGFKCYEVGVVDGTLTLIAAEEGAVALRAAAQPDKVPPVMLRRDALVDL